jgi:hypothetical protein
MSKKQFQTYENIKENLHRDEVQVKVWSVEELREMISDFRPVLDHSGPETQMMNLEDVVAGVQGVGTIAVERLVRFSKWIMDIHWLSYQGIKCQPLVAVKPPFSESFSHLANEYAKIEGLITATKVMTSAILRLCT